MYIIPGQSIDWQGSTFLNVGPITCSSLTINGYKIPAATVGGNGASDAGKLALFGGNGVFTASGLAVSTVGGTTKVLISSTSIGIQSASGTITGSITSSATASRAWVLPDAAGTFAMTNNLAGIIAASAALPTADPHVVGSWWNNSGVVTVSAG